MIQVLRLPSGRDPARRPSRGMVGEDDGWVTARVRVLRLFDRANVTQKSAPCCTHESVRGVGNLDHDAVG